MGEQKNLYPATVWHIKMLKRSYATKAEIPAGYENCYEEKEGKWVLKVEIEGTVTKDKLDEFRSNNITLKKEIDELKARYGDIDPEEHKKLRAKAQKQEEEDAKKAGKLDELVQQRTEERVKLMQTEHAKEIETLKKQTVAQQGELSRLVVEKGIAEAAMKKKVLSTAVEDVITRGKTVFKLEDGKAVPYSNNGEKVYGADGALLTIDGWLDQLIPAAPHLFEASVGSGASGKGGGAPGTQKNPWNPASFNLTEQGAIYKANRPLAIRLAAEHGVKLP